MIVESIDNLSRKLQRKNILTPQIRLYSESLKAKFGQVQWSLAVLREIEHKPTIQATATSTEAWDRIGTNEKIVFFCECFWDFLRSSIDIAAQLVNESRLLNMDEDDVSFYNVRDKMRPTMSATPLFKALLSLERNWAFKELNSYRHCSTHRRQVCIFELPTNPAPLTTVYSYLSATTVVMNRYLCNNPSSLSPRLSQDRPVVEYNQRIMNEIERRLAIIVNRL